MIAKTAQQVRIRNFRWEDLPAITEARRQTTLHDRDEQVITEEQFRHELESPVYDALNDAFVAEIPDGEIVGFCDGEVDTDNGRAYGYGFIVPEQRRQGVGKRLLDTTDRRLAERLTEEVNIRTWVADDPMTCVARGAGRVLEDYTNLRRLLVGLERGSTRH